MDLRLQTYNGTSITAYFAKITEGPNTIKARIISNERVNEIPAYAGKSFEPTKFDIACTLTSLHTDAEALGKIFNPRNPDLMILVAHDANASNAPYYINCTVEKIYPISGKLFKVQMWASDPVWKKVTAATKTINVTGVGTTTDAAVNGGNVDAYPSITITPTTTGGANSYRRNTIFYSKSVNAATKYPLDITSGGFDTASLVNDTTVSNQINQVGGVTAAAGQTCPVDTAVGGGLPASGVGYCGTEQFSYTIVAGTMTWNTRGINGTTAAVHADNAVIARSLMQANGNDIEVLYNGTKVPYWLGSMNSANTKIWTAQDYGAKNEAVLGAALGSSGNTTITFAATTVNNTFLTKIPNTGVVYIDTEAIAYTAKNVTARTLTIADANRGAMDTTAATHVINSTVRFLPWSIITTYGNLNATTRVNDDTYKPVFSLANSTNTNWRWDSADAVFSDSTGLRTGGWKPSVPVGKFSNYYTGNQATYGTDPVTDMGAEIVAYQDVVYKSEKAAIYWTFYNPYCVTAISSLGEKYKLNSTTTWPVAQLQSSLAGTTYVTEWTETTPASAATWTAWTRAGEAVATGTRYLRFVFYGAVQATLNNTARFEVNLGSAGSNGVTIDSNTAPSVTLKSQASNAEINVVLANTTTGDSLTVSYPLVANTTLTIDTENRQMSYTGMLISPPDLSSIRQEWLRLQPGSNTITYTDSTTGNVTVVFTYNERKNV